MACDHPNHEAFVTVQKVQSVTDPSDYTEFRAVVQIRCNECGARFGFRGSPAGESEDHPRCSPDALVMFLPLMSPSEIELAGPVPALARGVSQ